MNNGTSNMQKIYSFLRLLTGAPAQDWISLIVMTAFLAVASRWSEIAAMLIAARTP